jgi:hypothetical protein
MLVEKGWFIPTLQFGPDDVFLVEDWDETPVGPYKAIFHFTPDDFRTLYVNNEEGRDLVSTIHRFDAMNVVDILSQRGDRRWNIEADTGEKGGLRIEVDYMENSLLKVVNPVASHTPEFIARNQVYCKFLPKIAAPLMGTDPGQKIAGVTEMGRKTRFRMDRIYKISGARCFWGERDIGPLTDCRYGHNMGDYRPVSKAMVSYLSLFVD